VTSDAGTVTRAALELGSATLGESGARRMHPRIKPVWKGARIAAPAFPVRCTPGDNLALHVAVARAPEGSALVADMGGTRDFGYWGEVLTTGAEARGLTALVIDACVRDCDALEAHGFPVFATGLALTGAGKSREGSLREPVTVGDAVVELGDWVVGGHPRWRPRRRTRRGPGPGRQGSRIVRRAPGRRDDAGTARSRPGTRPGLSQCVV
jgi:4-hydroxy-4-methyl-2-oxoglutarate aldolase